MERGFNRQIAVAASLLAAPCVHDSLTQMHKAISNNLRARWSQCDKKYEHRRTPTGYVIEKLMR